MVKEMRAASFAILTALADGPLHGYAIIGEAAALTNGHVQLLAGTLYTALERLRSEHLIEVDREEVVQGRLRRFYALTEVGGMVLQSEAERRRSAAQQALDRLRSKRRVPGTQS